MHGCHDFSPYVGVEAMVQFWETQEAERIFSLRRALVDELNAGVSRRLGWRRLESRNPACRGPLQIYRLPERLQPEGKTLVERLAREFRLQTTVVCLEGSWHLVLSPHVYNDREELDLAVDALTSL